MMNIIKLLGNKKILHEITESFQFRISNDVYERDKSSANFTTYGE